MKKYYIIELGGEKEIHEMKALELNNINEAIAWIKGVMESDEEYFNINIDCSIDTFKYEQYGSDLDFYCQALVCVEYESIVTYTMIDSEVYSIETIIESNLSVISKITTRMVEK